MAFNNDNFSGFDTSGGFGGSTSSFSDDFSNEFNSGFDDLDTSGGFDTQNGFDNQNNQQQGGNEFDGMFTDNINSSDDDNDSGNLKKTAIIAVIVGVVVIIGGLLLANAFKNNKEKPDENGVTIVEQPEESNNGPTQLPPSQNANDIMQSGNEPSSNTTVYVEPTNKETDDSWTVIDDKQEIVFNGEYKELMFFITGIEHRAKLVDNSLIVKTVLTGSLSGMSGTYELDVPYHKGVKLLVGQEFNVKVLIGSFNGKTVVGDIKY